ncbi:MAG: site-specific integrase, partial [Ginsengibacter sp.]
MSVILRKRKNANGTTSLRLDIFHNGMRKIETLKHLQLSKATTLVDREHNKRKLQQAEEIAITRGFQLQADNYNMVSDAGKKTIITVWMQNFVDAYKKKDVRMMQAATDRFSNFLKEEKKDGLTFMNLTPLLIEDFMEYLDNKSYGEGAMSYYKRFKKMVKQAYRKNLLKENPTDKVEKKLHGKAAKKDILTIPELKILAATHTESSEVRRAFLFCCVTGLRWIDVNNLQWSNIRWESKEMNVSQSKTDEDVYTPLNDTAMKLLKEPGKKEDFIFHLPSHAGANKTLRAWVKRAGIDKKISWHNSRHSYGTNLIFNGVDLLTTSKLLGHTSLKHTQRYVNSAREMKEK